MIAYKKVNKHGPYTPYKNGKQPLSVSQRKTITNYAQKEEQNSI